MKSSKPSELRYKGRKVDPKTFKAEKKDLEQLVGWCGCGKRITGIEAVPHPDPFQSEINCDQTPVVQCGECDCDSSWEI